MGFLGLLFEDIINVGTSSCHKIHLGRVVFEDELGLLEAESMWAAWSCLRQLSVPISFEFHLQQTTIGSACLAEN